MLFTLKLQLMTPQFKTAYNAVSALKEGKGRTFTQKSLTVPDQSLTIRQILVRHTSGRPITMREGKFDVATEDVKSFDDLDIMPDLSGMDLAERQAMLEKVDNEILDIKRKMGEEALKRQKNESEAEIEKRVHARLQDLSKLKAKAAGSAGEGE